MMNATDKTYQIPVLNGFQKTLEAMFSAMLEKGGLDSLLIPKRTASGFYVPTLISDPNNVRDVNPFAGVMTINTATLISNITRLAPSPSKIGVVLRPCEYRAYVELVKLKQIHTENLITIVADCPGTFTMTEYMNLVSKKSADEEIAIIAEHGCEQRIACRTCVHCIPEGDAIDIKIHLFGIDTQKSVLLEGCTESGTNLLKNIGASETQMPGTVIKKQQETVEARKKANAELIPKEKEKFMGIENITKTFETCISCHNCMDMCPICYCKECFFESPTFEYEPENYIRWAERKGSTRMPVGTVMFHLGRLNHMAVSCVACGMCEQACPAKIPLLTLFKSVGEDLQKTFEYLPGRSIKEPLPLIVYKEKELEPQ